MQTMIVYVDDAAYARKMLQPLLPVRSANPLEPSMHWAVVACTPHVSHDITKWVSAHALELWRQDVAQAVFDDITPLLQAAGDTVSTQLANQKQSLIEQTNALSQQHLHAKVLAAPVPRGNRRGDGSRNRDWLGGRVGNRLLKARKPTPSKWCSPWFCGLLNRGALVAHRLMHSVGLYVSSLHRFAPPRTARRPWPAWLRG